MTLAEFRSRAKDKSNSVVGLANRYAIYRANKKVVRKPYELTSHYVSRFNKVYEAEYRKYKSMINKIRSN